MRERIQKNHNLIAKFHKLYREINALYSKTTKKFNTNKTFSQSVFSAIKVVDLLCMFIVQSPVIERSVMRVLAGKL